MVTENNIAMSLNVTHIETELPELLTEVFDFRLIEAKADVQIRHEGQGSSFSITPFESLYASVYAFYENGGPIIYLTVGENTVLEVPITGKRYTEETGEDELLGILRAIINLGFEETIWEIDGRVVKSIAKLPKMDGSEPITIISSSLYNPFRHKSVHIRKYQPYYSLIL